MGQYFEYFSIYRNFILVKTRVTYLKDSFLIKEKKASTKRTAQAMEMR